MKMGWTPLPEDMTTDGHKKSQIGLKEHKSEREADKREGEETRSETMAGKYGSNCHKNESSGRLVFLQQWSEIG